MISERRNFDCQGRELSGGGEAKALLDATPSRLQTAQSEKGGSSNCPVVQDDMSSSSSMLPLLSFSSVSPVGAAKRCAGTAWPVVCVFYGASCFSDVTVLLYHRVISLSPLSRGPK